MPRELYDLTGDWEFREYPAHARRMRGRMVMRYVSAGLTILGEPLPARRESG